MDNNVKMDAVMEINDRIKLLADKEKVKEIETAVYPMLNDLITQTKNFNDEISINKANWLRIDELLGDKASKFDVKGIKDKVDLCLPLKIYQEQIDVQDEINKTLNDQIKDVSHSISGHKTMVDFLLECTEKAKVDIAALQDSQRN